MNLRIVLTFGNISTFYVNVTNFLLYNYSFGHYHTKRQKRLSLFIHAFVN